MVSDKARQPGGGWLMGKVVGVASKGSYFLREAQAGPHTEDVHLSPSLVPKCSLPLQVTNS